MVYFLGCVRLLPGPKGEWDYPSDDISWGRIQFLAHSLDLYNQAWIFYIFIDPLNVFQQLLDSKNTSQIAFLLQCPIKMRGHPAFTLHATVELSPSHKAG